MKINFEQYLEWIKLNTPLTNAIIKKHAKKKFKNISLAYAAMIEPKMISHMEFLLDAGVRLFVSPCVPLIYTEESLHYLKKKGAVIFGEKAKTWAELEKEWRKMLRHNPDFIMDTGGGLIKEAVAAKTKIKAAVEGTGTGIDIVKTMTPDFPVFNLDDIPLKNYLHNRYEVGPGVYFGLRWLTNIDFCRKKVGIVGFGLVGQGIAHTARGAGAIVSISEINDFRTLVAQSEGFTVCDINTMLRNCDIIITATAKQNVIDFSKISDIKDGLILANAGFDDREINISKARFKKDLFNDISHYVFKNKNFYLLNKGKLLNLGTPYGSAVNTFDPITALFLEAACFIMEKGFKYKNGLQPAPAEVSRYIEKISNHI